MICLEPASEAGQPGHKDIVLSCGIHGNETAPIEICNQLLTRLLAEELKVRHRVLFLFGNPAAMNQGEGGGREHEPPLLGRPQQGEGLCNRERIRAMRLEQYVSRFFADSGRPRYHYDLHTAIRGSRHEKFAVYPFPTNAPTARSRYVSSVPAACAPYCSRAARPPPSAITARTSTAPMPLRWSWARCGLR